MCESLFDRFFIGWREDEFENMFKLFDINKRFFRWKILWSVV